MKSTNPISRCGAIQTGRPWPLGVEWVSEEEALNFAFYSRHATGVTLLGYVAKDPARPVFEFRFQHPAHKTGNIWHCRIPADDPQEGNYWGYMTLHFFSPHQQYAQGEAFEEFRAMVQAFHAAGIEVWLDVVYNQDNEITWLDWARLQENQEVFRFFKLMIAFRKAHPSIGRHTFWREDVKWFGTDGPVDLGADSRCLAYFLDGESVGDDDLYVMINGHWEDRTFFIQNGVASAWRRVLDTSKPSPEDIVEPGQEAKLGSTNYPVRARSVVVLRKAQDHSAQEGDTIES